MERSEPIGAEQEDAPSVVSLEQILTSRAYSTKAESLQQSSGNSAELVSRIQILEKKIEHQRFVVNWLLNYK